MKNKKLWIIFGIFLVILATLSIIKGLNEDSWICSESGWVKHGNPDALKPVTPCGKAEKIQVIKKYFEDNISIESAEKEVLGGKFYITKVDLTDDNSGIVEYEDGHIALKASFYYKISEAISKLNGLPCTVEITNFNIIK